ncbi:hypothetical protein EQ718_07080 [Paracoccus versutus]|uniref:Uncharacterized protein n=1 Tax=Paracoccus versutus TaxID=34007 RepID=A0AAQ0HKU8_PARVE|nr:MULTISPECIES: hypothetical protein [Paracoccus]SFY41430.1 hypothetical protein SAMN04244548_04313 [Paracoccus pantotrophus]KGJ12360.1 hypothetical protein IT40_02290 [Paracoccus versutus]MBT0780448.1 hypothetical protein [Paracoccus sp. pheM1]MCJ1900461.1 hypothetical protein [Paracoccus versutus]MDF3906046.1 hypothetical protein [Paracoccus sp. AS002]
MESNDKRGEALEAFVMDLLLSSPLLRPGREHETARSYQDKAAVSHPEVARVLREAADRLLHG